MNKWELMTGSRKVWIDVTGSVWVYLLSYSLDLCCCYSDHLSVSECEDATEVKD